jgi:hypothetical protein
MSNEPSEEPRSEANGLRRRVAPLCHAIRWSAVGWGLWATATALMVFAGTDHVAEHYGRALKTDLGQLPVSGYVMALTIIVLDLALAWLVIAFVWRLFGRYLRGDIFSHVAVAEMWRVGWAGVAAVAADIVARPLLAYALTLHLDESQRHHFWTTPEDLLHLLMVLFIVALAHIFRAGVEIADDHRQIV